MLATNHAVLMHEIDSLPPDYWGEVLAFVKQLKKTAVPVSAGASAPAAKRERWIPVISWLEKRRQERQTKALMNLYGCLANSDAFGDDPVAYFRKERDEWDARLEPFYETKNSL